LAASWNLSSKCGDLKKTNSSKSGEFESFFPLKILVSVSHIFHVEICRKFAVKETLGLGV
jgi:hypothetical protein